MTNSALLHLKLYPADTLDARTLEILIGEADKGLAEIRYLVHFVPPGDSLLGELQDEIAELTTARELMSQEREKKLQAHREVWARAIDEGRVVRFVTRGGSTTEDDYPTPELAAAAIAELSQNYTFTRVDLVKNW